MPRKPSQADTLKSMSQTAAARLMGVSARSLRDWRCPRNDDGTYNGTTLVQWRIEQLVGQEREKLMGEDAVMLGVDSPAMERWRLAKAQIAEIDLAEKRGQLVPADTAQLALQIVAARLRRMGERLIKTFGNDAGAMVMQSLDEAERDMEQRWGAGHE